MHLPGTLLVPVPLALALLLAGGHAAGADDPGSVGAHVAVTPSVAAIQSPDTVPGSPSPSDVERSILSVTGSAQVEARPDRATVLFAVETEGETAQEAGESNARLMTTVTEAIRTAGDSSPGLRIESSGYSVSPRYGPTTTDRTREIVGYTARNGIRTTVDDPDRLGALVDAALGAGANRISNLRFEVRDPEPYRQEALREAVRKARGEAETIAEALGMRLGAALEVEGGADITFARGVSFQAESLMRDAADAVPTPIEAGLETIPAEVRIRFRLEPLP